MYGFKFIIGNQFKAFSTQKKSKQEKKEGKRHAISLKLVDHLWGKLVEIIYFFGSSLFCWSLCCVNKNYLWEKFFLMVSHGFFFA